MIFRVLAASFLAFFTCAVAAIAQNEEVEITSADLAASYQRVDGAFQETDTLAPEKLADLNRTFDRATLQFFQRKYGPALKMIDESYAAIIPDTDPRILSFRVSLDPPVLVLDESPSLTVKLETLYTLDAKFERESLEVVLVNTKTKNEVTVAMFHISADLNTSLSITSTHDKPAPNLESGRYYVSLRTLNGSTLAGQYTVVSKSLESQRAAFEQQLEGIEAGSPALTQALASTRARIALLSDEPSPANTAQIVLDPLQLVDEIRGEIAALKKGEDPFKHRKGDHWRVFHTAAKDIAARVYLPESADLSKPISVVVALHGAGVDENVFMDGYGAGVLKSLADKHGFLVASPTTYDMAANAGGERFDAVLDALALVYPIDRDRVYVLGHSMGGGATAALAAARPDAIRAAACIAGFRGFGKAEVVPPTLAIAAEHDPLANPQGVEAAYKAAKAAGHDVEYKFMAGYGHTLVVGKVLPDTIDWLLAR